jgi:hypothetical protein
LLVTVFAKNQKSSLTKAEHIDLVQSATSIPPGTIIHDLFGPGHAGLGFALIDANETKKFSVRYFRGNGCGASAAFAKAASTKAIDARAFHDVQRDSFGD